MPFLLKGGRPGNLNGVRSFNGVQLFEGGGPVIRKTKHNFQLEKELFTLDNCSIYFFSRLQTELVAVAGGVGLHSLSFLRVNQLRQ